MAGFRAGLLLLASTVVRVCTAQNVTLLNLLSVRFPPRLIDTAECSISLPRYALQRPDIHAPTVYVTINNAAKVAPGLIMITPSSPGATNFDVGPYIYNSQGVCAPEIDV